LTNKLANNVVAIGDWDTPHDLWNYGDANSDPANIKVDGGKHDAKDICNFGD